PGSLRYQRRAESGGVRSTIRMRTSASRPAGNCGGANEITVSGTVSAGGGWYSLNPIWPTRAGIVARSTAPALNTYTPGVTMNLPPSARAASALPAVTAWTANVAPRSGSVTVIGHDLLIARVTILSTLGISNGSRIGTASG